MNLFYVGSTAIPIAFNAIVFPLEVQSLSLATDKGLVLGTIATLALGSGILTSIFSGILSDHSRSKWGRRGPYVFLGMILAVPSILLTGFLPLSLLSIAVSYVFMNAFTSFSFGAYQPLLADIIPLGQRGGAAALQLIFSVAGAVLGYNIAAPLVSAGNYLLALSILAFIFLATTVASILFVRPFDLNTLEVPSMKVLDSIKEIFRLGDNKSGLYTMIGAALFFSLGSSTLQFFGVYYLETVLRVDRPAEALALAGTVTLVVSTTANSIWFRLSSKERRRRMMISVTLLAAVLNLVFPFLPGFGIYLVVAPIYGTALGLFYSSYIARASELVPKNESGKYMAYSNLPFGIGTALSPIIGGVVLSVYGGAASVEGFVALFIVSSGFLFASTVALAVSRVRK